MSVTYKTKSGKIKTKEFSSAFMCKRFIIKISESKDAELVWYPSWVLVGRR